MTNLETINQAREALLHVLLQGLGLLEDDTSSDDSEQQDENETHHHQAHEGIQPQANALKTEPERNIKHPKESNRNQAHTNTCEKKTNARNTTYFVRLILRRNAERKAFLH